MPNFQNDIFLYRSFFPVLSSNRFSVLSLANRLSGSLRPAKTLNKSK